MRTTFRFRGIERQWSIDQREARRRALLDRHRPPSMLLLETWAPVEDELRQAVDAPTFNMHLDPLHPHRIQNGAWVLACQDVAWIKDRFGKLIAECAQRPCHFVICEATP